MKFSIGRFSMSWARVLAVVIGVVSTNGLSAQTIDFESLVSGESLFGIDTTTDGRDDVRFSTTADGGFTAVGPDPSAQVFVSGLVLETSSIGTPDVRVDFPGGAVESIQFGFVLLTQVDDAGQGMQLGIFDRAGERLASVFQAGENLPVSLPASNPSFPEGQISASFSGVASYALLDATTTGGRFVIDDFSGTFLPASIPEPGGVIGLGLLTLLGRRRLNSRSLSH